MSPTAFSEARCEEVAIDRPPATHSPVPPCQLSVRNGEAGSPALFIGFGVASFRQAPTSDRTKDNNIAGGGGRLV